MATIFRAPLATRRAALRPVSPPAGPASLLLTTLRSADKFFGGPGQGPVYDWPNPARRKSTGITEQPPSLLQGPLQPLPSGSLAFEWPNPVNRRQPDLTWTGSLPLPFDGGELPFGQSDWQNPKPRAKPDVTFTGSLPLPFDGGEQPFGQSDWINPGRAKPRATEQPPALLQGVLQPLPVGGAMLHQPKVLQRRDSDSLPSLLLTTLADVAGVPFFQVEWLNPKAKASSTRIVEAPNLSVTTLVGQDQFFWVGGPVYHWPNPKRTRQDDLTFISTLPTPFSSGTAAAPFFQIEWPNPVKHGALLIPSQFVETLTLLLAPVGKRFPFVPRDPKLELPLRRFVDVVSQIVNSLMRQEVLIKSGQSSWRLARSGGIVSTRMPLPSDDAAHGYFVGQVWVDQTSGTAYVATSVAANAAIWRPIS